MSVICSKSYLYPETELGKRQAKDFCFWCGEGFKTDSGPVLEWMGEHEIFLHLECAASIPYPWRLPENIRMDILEIVVDYRNGPHYEACKCRSIEEIRGASKATKS